MANDAPLLIDVSRLVWRRWAGRRPTGIDRVCLAYLEHFAPRAQAVIQSSRFRRILDRRVSDALFALLLEAPETFRRQLAMSGGHHALQLARPLPGNNRLYLNIGHTGLDQPGFAAWTRRAGVRPIYLIHDLIPITHPEYCRSGESDRHRARMRVALETGAGIIGNSKATLDALSAFAQAEGLPMPAHLAAWLGGTPLAAPAPIAPPARPSFVLLGTIEGRKNHLLMLKLWTKLIRELGADAPQLLIVGQRGWEAEQVFDMLDRSTALRGHVIEIGNCTDAELAGHLAHARALLFPSMVEGFGLPLIEALGAGIPVIASDLPVFREIGRDIPDYLSPIDGIGWKQAIVDYARPDSGARKAQLDRMAGYRMPDWPSHFAGVDAWLDLVPDS